MTPFRRSLFAAALLFVGAGASYLYAQPDGEGGDDAADVVVPMETEAKLSPAEMESKSREILSEIGVDVKRIEDLKSAARKQKDVIKLNCINDKLVQANELIKIADTAQVEMAAAIATGDEAERYHRFSMITISGEKVDGLREEAEACVGEEIDYLGPLDIGVDSPAIPDDPTLDDPFTDDWVEPPGYASPFE